MSQINIEYFHVSGTMLGDVYKLPHYPDTFYKVDIFFIFKNEKSKAWRDKYLDDDDMIWHNLEEDFTFAFKYRILPMKPQL